MKENLAFSILLENRTYDLHVYLTTVRSGLTFNFVRSISQKKNPYRLLKIGMSPIEVNEREGGGGNKFKIKH